MKWKFSFPCTKYQQSQTLKSSFSDKTIAKHSTMVFSCFLLLLPVHAFSFIAEFGDCIWKSSSWLFTIQSFVFSFLLLIRFQLTNANTKSHKKNDENDGRKVRKKHLQGLKSFFLDSLFIECRNLLFVHVSWIKIWCPISRWPLNKCRKRYKIAICNDNECHK